MIWTKDNISFLEGVKGFLESALNDDSCRDKAEIDYMEKEIRKINAIIKQLSKEETK